MQLQSFSNYENFLMDLGEINDICELQAAYFRGEHYMIGIKYPQ